MAPFHSIPTPTQAGTAQGQMLFWDDTLKTWAYSETSEIIWDDTNKFLGLNTTTPVGIFDINGHIAAPPANTFPVAYISDNLDAISGVIMGNASTGTAADFRFMIADTTGHYMAFAQPGVNNTAGVLFGTARSGSDFIFNNAGTTRKLAIGTLGANDFILGTQNTARITISPDGGGGLVAITNGLTVNTTDLVVDDTLHTVAIGSADGSDSITFSHDNTNAHAAWTDGEFIFQTSETDAVSDLNIIGNGTGKGRLSLANTTFAEWKIGDADMDTIPGGNADYRLFFSAGEGNVKEFKIAGFRTGDVRRLLAIGVGEDAADTASFDGLSNYWFDGTVRTGAFATNYIELAPTGLTMAGTARVQKHMHFVAELGKGGSAPTVRYTEDPYVSYTYILSQGDDSHITEQVPDDMDFTADAMVYVHWYTTDATAVGADEVRWEAQWASRAVGEDITAGDTTDNSGDIVCSAANIVVSTLTETIPANSMAHGDILGLHIQRVALGDGTSPTAGSVHVLDVEVEYTSNKLGEPL